MIGLILESGGFSWTLLLAVSVMVSLGAVVWLERAWVKRPGRSRRQWQAKR
jgi:hypothetical protein